MWLNHLQCPWNDCWRTWKSLGPAGVNMTSVSDRRFLKQN